MLELCRVKRDIQLAVLNVRRNILTPVVLRLVVVHTEQCAGAVDTVLVRTAADDDVAGIRIAVRIKEGQRRIGDHAHTQIVARIELQRCHIALAGDLIIRIQRADPCPAVILRTRHNRLIDTVRLVDRQLTIVVGRQGALFALAVGVDHIGLDSRDEAEYIQLILQHCRCYIKARLDARIGMCRCDGDLFALAGLFLADHQEIRCRSIGGIAVVADIRVDTALLVVHAHRRRIAGLPHHLIGEHTPDTLAVVDGYDLLEGHIGTKCGEIVEGKLIFAIFVNTVICHLAVVIHRHGRIPDTFASTACRAADLTGSDICYDLVEDIRIVHGQEHGVNAPVALCGISCIDRDGIRFLQACGGSWSERNHAAGNRNAVADILTGLLDRVLDLSRRFGNRVADDRNIPGGDIVAVKLVQAHRGRSLLCHENSRGRKELLRRYGLSDLAADILGRDLDRIRTLARELAAGNGNVCERLSCGAGKAACPDRLAGAVIRILRAGDRCCPIDIHGEHSVLAKLCIPCSHVGGECHIGINAGEGLADLRILRDVEERGLALQNVHADGGKRIRLILRAVADCEGECHIARLAGEFNMSHAVFIYSDRRNALVTALPCEIICISKGELLASAEL